MWTSGYVKNTSLATHVRFLNMARQLAGGANSSFYTTAARFIHQSSPSLLAVWKPPLLALLTNIGSAARSPPTWNIPASERLFKSKEKVVDILTCVSFTADDNGGLSIVAEGGIAESSVASFHCTCYRSWSIVFERCKLCEAKSFLSSSLSFFVFYFYNDMNVGPLNDYCVSGLSLHLTWA